jgi:hypothetical protein
MQTTTKAPKAPAKFSWDEENQAVIAQAYLEQKEIDHIKANSKGFLGELARKVGAKSDQSVRSKLAALKVYVAAEKVSNTIAKPRITKPILADEIRGLVCNAGVDLSEDAANSLANANAEALKALIKALSVDEEK